MVTSDAKRHFRYYGYEAAGRIDRVAQCVLPGGDAAMIDVARVFGLVLQPIGLNPAGRRLSIASAPWRFGVRHDGEAVALETVVVNACQYGGTHPDCWGRPDAGVPAPGGGGGHPWAGGGGGGGGDEPSPEPMTENDVPEHVGTPDCSSPRSLMEQAYCSGKDPDTTQLARIKDTLARMRAIGCGDLADAANTVLENKKMKLFVRQAGWNFSGTAEKLGDWMAIDIAWVDFNYGPRNGSGFTLDFALAHETDHHLGRDHLPGQAVHTPNSERCMG